MDSTIELFEWVQQDSVKERIIKNMDFLQIVKSANASEVFSNDLKRLEMKGLHLKVIFSGGGTGVRWNWQDRCGEIHFYGEVGLEPAVVMEKLAHGQLEQQKYINVRDGNIFVTVSNKMFECTVQTTKHFIDLFPRVKIEYVRLRWERFDDVNKLREILANRECETVHFEFDGVKPANLSKMDEFLDMISGCKRVIFDSLGRDSTALLSYNKPFLVDCYIRCSSWVTLERLKTWKFEACSLDSSTLEDRDLVGLIDLWKGGCFPTMQQIRIEVKRESSSKFLNHKEIAKMTNATELDTNKKPPRSPFLKKCHTYEVQRNDGVTGRMEIWDVNFNFFVGPTYPIINSVDSYYELI